MIAPLWGALSGHKTYIGAVLTIVGAITGYLTGNITPGEALTAIGGSIQIMALRHGIANS